MIGTEFTTSQGCRVIVINYVSFKRVQIKFLDEYEWTTWVELGNLRKGQVKNPFHPSVCGVGYLGVDENNKPQKTNGENLRPYKVWTDMLQRCYDEKCLQKKPSYENVTVCKEWLCFSKFLEDITKIKNYEYWRDNPRQGISLNKDMYYVELGINTDCKEYNLVTTRFIPNKENAKESGDRTSTKKKVKCIETNTIYESTRQAERETGIPHSDISKCCRGLKEDCKGLHFEYI